VNPLEPPGGGPNFHRFDDNVLYSIHIDNEGDGEEDIDFNFQFKTSYAATDAFGLETFIYNIGPVGTVGSVYQTQSYTVERVDDGVATTILSDGATAPINVGTQSGSDGLQPDRQHARRDHHGQHRDVRRLLGLRRAAPGGASTSTWKRTFDLLNLAGLDGTPEPEHAARLQRAQHRDRDADHGRDEWTARPPPRRTRTASSRPGPRPPVAPFTRASFQHCGHRGSRRLGAGLAPRHPLVNEVVIPVQEKDTFNASHPRDDIQFSCPTCRAPRSPRT